MNEREKAIKERLKALEAKKEALQAQEFKEKQEAIKNIKENINTEYKVEKKIEPIKKESHPPRKTPKQKKKIDYFTILMVIIFIISLLNLGYQILFAEEANKLYSILYSGLLSGLIFCITFYKNKVFKHISLLLFVMLIASLFLENFYGVSLSKEEIVPNFIGTTLNEVLNWGETHSITINQEYEYSDTYKENEIMMQNVIPETKVKDINELLVTISQGPNLDKLVIISNMVGWNIDEALVVLNENFLNNINIEYIFSDDTKRDIILNQSYAGEMKRNDLLTFTVSLGSESELEQVQMIDLKNKPLFDATLFLKKNGIKYEIEYDYSSKIKKDYVISQSELAGTTINQKTTTVKLIISKGQEIKVPNLLSMTSDEIVKWVVDNNLKITFNEKYDMNIEKGKVTNANYKEGDIVSEGTQIDITLSKGQLKLINFNSLSEFRTWATNNGVTYKEEYEFNDSVPTGNIIKFSLNINEIVNPNDTLIVYISNGASSTVPNFYGLTKTEASKKCSDAGLTCTFYDVNSSKTKGTAVSQSKKAKSVVSKGTKVSIGLSTGKTNNTSTPTCDTSKGATFYIAPGSTGSQVYQATKNQNPNFKINVTYVDNCDNGATTSGMVCNSSSYDAKWISYCTTINLKIVK